MHITWTQAAAADGGGALAPPARQTGAPAPAAGSHLQRIEERALAAYLGFAVGDALGASVQYMTEREIRASFGVHRELTGGGWLRLKPGAVTDETEMCLLLGEMLLKRGGWDLQTAAAGFVEWMRHRPVDVDHTVRHGIQRHLADGSLSAPPSDKAIGSAACVRVLPAVLYRLQDAAGLKICVLEQAHLTHRNPLSDAACLLLGGLLQRLLLGESRDQCRHYANSFTLEHRALRFDPYPGRASEYVVDVVQTVLHSFFYNGSFESCVVEVVNRGADTTATGALAGMLAGALYGLHGIPARWLGRLDPGVAQRIYRQAPALVRLASAGR